MSIKVWHSKHK